MKKILLMFMISLFLVSIVGAQEVNWDGEGTQTLTAWERFLEVISSNFISGATIPTECSSSSHTQKVFDANTFSNPSSVSVGGACNNGDYVAVFNCGLSSSYSSSTSCNYGGSIREGTKLVTSVALNPDNRYMYFCYDCESFEFIEFTYTCNNGYIESAQDFDFVSFNCPSGRCGGAFVKGREKSSKQLLLDILCVEGVQPIETKLRCTWSSDPSVSECNKLRVDFFDGKNDCSSFDIIDCVRDIPSITCLDSDSGVNAYIKGQTTGLWNNVILTKTDFCTSSEPNSVQEFSCSDGSLFPIGTVVQAKITCNSGDVCDDGICFNELQTLPVEPPVVTPTCTWEESPTIPECRDLEDDFKCGAFDVIDCLREVSDCSSTQTCCTKEFSDGSKDVCLNSCSDFVLIDSSIYQQCLISEPSIEKKQCFKLDNQGRTVGAGFVLITEDCPPGTSDTVPTLPSPPPKICAKTLGAECSPPNSASGQTTECATGWCDDVFEITGLTTGRCAKPPREFEGHPSCKTEINFCGWTGWSPTIPGTTQCTSGYLISGVFLLIVFAISQSGKGGNKSG